jgi:hypothetical protein
MREHTPAANVESYTPACQHGVFDKAAHAKNNLSRGDVTGNEAVYSNAVGAAIIEASRHAPLEAVLGSEPFEFIIFATADVTAAPVACVDKRQQLF